MAMLRSFWGTESDAYKILFNSSHYFLRDVVLDTAVKLWINTEYSGRPYVFQQDLAPSHKAQKTQEWIYLYVQVTQNIWSINSLDHNQLGHYAWRIVEKVHRSTKNSLKADIIRVKLEFHLFNNSGFILPITPTFPLNIVGAPSVVSSINFAQLSLKALQPLTISSENSYNLVASNVSRHTIKSFDFFVSFIFLDEITWANFLPLSEHEILNDSY